MAPAKRCTGRWTGYAESSLTAAIPSYGEMLNSFASSLFRMQISVTFPPNTRRHG